MKRNFLIDFFGLREKQKENRKNILRGLSLIIGSLFIAEGVVSLFPESFNKGGLIGVGLILVIISILD